MERLYATVDSLVTVLTVGGAERRNSMAYPKWGTYVWPNYYIAVSYADEIAYLKRWLRHRIRWMDEQLGFAGDDTLLRGDVNDDDEVTIADVGALINMILGNGTTPRSADVNSDGEVNVADVAALIDLMLSG